MIDLKGKTAIVLGVSRGNIGEAVARRFKALGAEVIIAGRTEPVIADLGRTMGVEAVKCDITDRPALDALAGLAVSRHGRLDIALNAVGANLVRPFLDVTRSELDQIVQTQLIGPFLFLQAMVGAMDRGGSIIQISSVTSKAMLPDHAAYMATKAAGDTLVRSVALDFGPRGIRVNSLSPGATLDAPMARELMEDDQAREAVRNIIPLRRIGTAGDVAHAAAWLASDECFITGENIQVNGGTAIHALRLADEQDRVAISPAAAGSS